MKRHWRSFLILTAAVASGCNYCYLRGSEEHTNPSDSWYGTSMLAILQEQMPTCKGLDELFPVPLEQFLKLEDLPWYPILIKYNIRGSTIASFACHLLAISVLIGWLVAGLWPTHGKRNASAQKKKKTPFRHGIIIVAVVRFFIFAPLAVNLMVLWIIDTALGEVTVPGVTRTPEDLSKLLIFSPLPCRRILSLLNLLSLCGDDSAAPIRLSSLDRLSR
ncbi:hypothetical protein IWW34DRAFT_797230 [Fusarium oxysporum f. sp. albedinis]|nr:hypothetical protein IWW34DRAFT_797230 [Fusarium oxysporum f. sp. albedinis]